MKKLFPKVMAFGLVAASLTTTTAFAAAPLDTTNDTLNQNAVAASDESVQPRSFTRTYTKYLSFDDSSEVTLLTDDNWDIWSDNKVTVTLKNPDKKTKIRTRVYYDEGSGWKEVSEGAYDLSYTNDSHTWTIPTDARFKVTVSWGQGSSKDYSFKVKLSS